MQNIILITNQMTDLVFLEKVLSHKFELDRLKTEHYDFININQKPRSYLNITYDMDIRDQYESDDFDKLKSIEDVIISPSYYSVDYNDEKLCKKVLDEIIANSNLVITDNDQEIVLYEKGSLVKKW